MQLDAVETSAFSFGPTLLQSGETRFRFWGPGVEGVELQIEGREPIAMQSVAGGWFVAEAPCGAGARYTFVLPDGQIVPDPASRLQDGDAHDASIVVDASAFEWQTQGWCGRPWHEAVIYELHVGAMGGFAGVTADLERLARLGVTAIELMPVADFVGERNWGYDGVLPYAPDTSYGTPDELRLLIDTAHGLGMMVMLDVVYNHFGPDGNYLSSYAPQFFRSDRKTPWGDSIDFRRPEVHRFFIENAIYWLQDFRIDGLRLDAVHAIQDDDFLRDLSSEVRAAIPAGRHIHLVLENEHNDASLLRMATDEAKFDAQWADDLHHCIHVLLTGESEAYYEAFSKQPAALLARCLAEGFAFQGEEKSGRGARGTPSAHLPPTSFIVCLQNHDQIGNRAFGDRLHELSHPDALRVATALLLLSPQIPLLFMGQEWATKSPFLYFAGHTGDLAEAVREGRRQEFAQFDAFQNEATRERIPDPNALETFQAVMPDTAEHDDAEHRAWFELHRSLLDIRARHVMAHIPGARSLGAEALGATGVVAKWRLGNGADLVIAANFGGPPLACAALADVGEIIFRIGGHTADMLSGRSLVAALKAPIA